MSLNLKLSDVFSLNSGMRFDKNETPCSVSHMSRHMMSPCLVMAFYHFVEVVSANFHGKVTIFFSVLSHILQGDTLTLWKYPVSHYTFVH